MKKTNNKGFSLVELIVVIAIMAVLVVAVAPQFLKYVERARKSNDVQSVASIVTCVQTYAADPMVNSSLQFAAGNYTFDLTTAETTLATTATPSVANALIDAGIKTVQLKSKNWNPTATDGKVTITFTVAADGSVTAKQTTPAATTTVDIVKGLYQ